jgi:hypothetical protein
MLTRAELEGLYKDLRQAMVLSVYVDGSQSDPADRRIWRTVLDGALADERRRVEAEAPDDLKAFDAARALIDRGLAEHRAFLQDTAWVGFATADELRYGQGVAVPMPDLVRWEHGIRVAPYVRALKQDRMVAAAVADSRRCRIFTYRDGEVEEKFDLVADQDFGDLADSVSSTRAGRFSGARGETGTETAQRLRERSAARMQSEILDALEKLVGSDGFVIFGGPIEVVTALARKAERFGDRFIEVPSMNMLMSVADAKTVIEEAASEVTRRRQDVLMQAVIDQARSGGKGSLGIQATKEALREGRVDSLLVSRRLREREPDLVDHFVGTAFEQGAAVEELSGVGADRLESEGEGVAARLRYTV